MKYQTPVEVGEADFPPSCKPDNSISTLRSCSPVTCINHTRKVHAPSKPHSVMVVPFDLQVPRKLSSAPQTQCASIHPSHATPYALDSCRRQSEGKFGTQLRSVGLVGGGMC